MFTWSGFYNDYNLSLGQEISSFSWHYKYFVTGKNIAKMIQENIYPSMNQLNLFNVSINEFI